MGCALTEQHDFIVPSPEAGMIYTDNLRSAKATDVFFLRGDADGEELIAPFTYHGFRYVEVCLCG